MKKRGQITIFIIVAILIVAIVAIIFMVSPKLKSSFGGKTESPQGFIQTCLEDSIKDNTALIASQGGSLEPENYILYQDDKIQYLCYSDEYYKPCVVQIPFIRDHIESEIKKSIQEDSNFCFNELKKNYPQSTLNLKDYSIDLLPGRIVDIVNGTFTYTKSGETKKIDNFRVVVNNNLYELTGIAQNIMSWEILYGEANSDYYMDLYKELKVEKYPQTDETNIYILTNKNTGDKFQFAFRSFAYSPEY